MSGNILYPDFSKDIGSFLDDPISTPIDPKIKLVYSDALKAYLSTQQNKDILVSSYKANGNMAMEEANIRLVSRSEMLTLINRSIPCRKTNIGFIAISNSWLPQRKPAMITFSLNSWLGIKHIVAEGLQRPNIFEPLNSILTDN